MQSSKSGWSLQLHQILIFLFILSVSSCGCKKGGGGKKGGGERVFIMLIHGIDDQRNGVSNLTYVIDPLKKALDNEQGNKKRVLEIFAPARQNSVTAPIQTQAADMFKVIQDKGITEKDKLVLIGNSQGGAVVMAMYAMFMRDWKNMAVISIQGALCGTPAAKHEKSTLTQLVSDIGNMVQYVKTNTTNLIKKVRVDMGEGFVLDANFLNNLGIDLAQLVRDNLPTPQAIQRMIEGFLEWQVGEGCKDMIPGSDFMNKLQQEMPNPVTIPMLLVAGQIDDFISCMSREILQGTVTRALPKDYAAYAPNILQGIVNAIKQDNTLKNMLDPGIRNEWKQMVGGGEENDILIPVSSQLGVGLLSGDKVQGQGKCWSDYTHTMPITSQNMFNEEIKFIKDFIEN